MSTWTRTGSVWTRTGSVSRGDERAPLLQLAAVAPLRFVFGRERVDIAGMWQRVPAREDEATLGQAWRTAEPFPHLVFDDPIVEDAARDLVAILDEEPLRDQRADIYAFEASAPTPVTSALLDLRESFAQAFAAPLGRITGKLVSRVDMRLYVYRPGHYLLPHSDHQDSVGRALAYAWYLPSPDPPSGGELELFRCTFEGREIVATESAKAIAPRDNRLVVFDVGDASLHQVREVLSGLRISLSGWFYP